MDLKQYLKENLKLKIEESYFGYEISITIENEVIDTVVVPTSIGIEDLVELEEY